MPVVNIPIGQRSFQLMCGEGQEAHLLSLAKDVSSRLESLSKSMETSNDTLLLVMTALMIQDDLNEINDNRPSAAYDEDRDTAINYAVADAISAISDYVDTVTERIENI